MCCCTHSCNSHIQRSDATVYSKGIKSPSLEFEFNLVFHKVFHWFEEKQLARGIIWLHLTLDQQHISRQILPLSLSSPTTHLLRFLIPHGPFRNDGFGNRHWECSLFCHQFISLKRGSKCPFHRSDWWKCSYFTAHHTLLLQPFPPPCFS